MNNTPYWTSRRPGNAYGGFTPYPGYDSNNIEPFFRHSFSFRSTAVRILLLLLWFATDPVRGSRDRWQMPEPPFGFSGFPDYQRAPTPVEMAWLDNFPTRPVNTRFSGGLPRTPTRQEDLRSNQDEQKNVLSKLKKEIYNPIPKQMTKRLNSYYRDRNSNEKAKVIDEDGKRCAICLEDFEVREQVMVTPCEHFFHEECILPWVKSHGQCPVCRFVISERIKQTASSGTDNNVPNVPVNDLFQGEMISIIRAMEEAFLWGNSL